MIQTVLLPLVYGTNDLLWAKKPVSYSEEGEWQHFEIRLGDFYTGDMNYLTFINEHDQGLQDGNSFYKNIRIYELDTNDYIHLDAKKFEEYGWFQDGAGDQVVSDDGHSVTLNGDAWRVFDLPYTVTDRTVLEFEFKADQHSTSHSIGVDTDKLFTAADTMFTLSGEIGNAIHSDDFNSYNYNNEWQHFAINLGDYVDGAINYLTFRNDGQSSDLSHYKNIRIYEAAEDSIYLTSDNPTLKSNTDFDDVLYSTTENDVLFGGKGADTFFMGFDTLGSFDQIEDFSLVDNDVINLANLIDQYDPLQNSIDEFVQITDNGSDSVLSVDVDGGADDFVQIAMLKNVTGLDDEAQLEANGGLVV